MPDAAAPTDASTAAPQGLWYVAAIARQVRAGAERAEPVFGRTLRLTRDGQGVVIDASPDPIAVRESEGLIWAWLAGPEGEAPPCGPPVFNGPGGKVRFVEEALLPGPYDDAVYGLLDPAHGPYVHASPLWRSSRTLREKAKDYVPSPLGFTMLAHEPKNSAAYKLIGGGVQVEIGFQLPALRSEWISNTANKVLGLTTLTPVDANSTRIRQIFYWQSPLLSLVSPFVRPFTRGFLQQDVHIMTLRQRAAPWRLREMLIRDGDQLFIWYRRMKAEWADARAAARPFENPVRAATLRWRT
jgi:phenylpropionate dioxygenase-like ring-hydroxylating dioxygenase large terminal subunit